jgi:F-type H+-transporting ATPase subunit delta
VANEQMPLTYAQAIFDQATGDWVAPLKHVSESFKPGEVEQLDQPGLAFARKQEIIQKVLPANAPAEVRNFLSLLASKNEMHLLPHVLAEFDRYSQRGAARPLAKVTSAVPLTDAEKATIEGKMRARFGAETDFQYVVDPSILGGVIVRMGDQVIDGSVSAKLAALREKLR